MTQMFKHPFFPFFSPQVDLSVHISQKKILYFEGQIYTLPLKIIQTSEQVTGRHEVVFTLIHKGTQPTESQFRRQRREGSKER